MCLKRGPSPDDCIQVGFTIDVFVHPIAGILFDGLTSTGFGMIVRTLPSTLLPTFPLIPPAPRVPPDPPSR
jgi:hypothetical protein